MRILLCIRDSVYSESAIKCGGLLAHNLNSDITVMTVMKAISSIYQSRISKTHEKLQEWGLDLPQTLVLKQARKILKDIGLDVEAKTTGEMVLHETDSGVHELKAGGSHGKLVTLKVRHGKPTEEIIEEAEEGNYDLIVVGRTQKEGVEKTAFLISPGIFFTIFGILILASAVAYIIQKKIGYNFNIVLGFIGLVIIFYPTFIIFKNVQIYFPLFYISLALIASTVSILGIIKYCNISYLEGLWVKIIIAAHMFDTSATVVAVEIYGYWEEHYIEGSIIESMGTSLILYPLKVLVLFTVIYMIQKILDDKNTISFWYLSIFILGFSPGLRDLLKIMLIG